MIVGSTLSNSDNKIKRIQSLLGCLMWLAYRTRPDLAYCVGIAAAPLTGDLKACSSGTRHLLQHVCTHQDAGLFYGFSEDLKREDATLELYGDASFAPDGGHSHTRWVLMRGLLSVGGIKTDSHSYIIMRGRSDCIRHSPPSLVFSKTSY